jgi:FkbM family methyltransferase
LHEKIILKKVQLANGLEIFEINSYETDFLYEEIFVQETYATYDLRIPHGGVVLDIGANIGMFGLYISRKFPGARIFCFEPAPHCLERLRMNLASLGETVQIFATALGDTTGEIEFSYYPRYSIMSGMFANEQDDVQLLKAGARTQFERKYGSAPNERALQVLVNSRLGDRQSFRCPITTVSKILAAEKIDRIALVKIDVERAEHAVLAGIDEVDWPRIDQVVVEVHDQGAQEHESVADMLKQRGYNTSLFTEAALVNSDIHVVVGKR